MLSELVSASKSLLLSQTLIWPVVFVQSYFYTFSDSRRPRYVRINTNLLTTSDAIRAFQDEGYRFIRCTSGSYADYLEQIKNITEEEFTQDYHIKTIFVFAPGTKWHNHELYLSNQIVLQDKVFFLRLICLNYLLNAVLRA